jgi:hypothetical protein
MRQLKEEEKKKTASGFGARTDLYLLDGLELETGSVENRTFDLFHIYF